MTEGDKKLSTTALARALDIPAQQLFATLQDYGWIKRLDSSWALTTKGEFEGGSYTESSRYGRYIVWPTSLQQHRLIADIEAQQKLTTAGVSRCFKLHPRLVNRAFAEMGLQQHTLLGWEITNRGKSLGGLQAESENSGALFVQWPRELVDDAIIRRELERLTHFEEQATAEGDLFDSGAQQFVALDGHRLESQLSLHVCNWLYLTQLAHAHARRLPVEEELYADFYLPGAGVYIECWEEEEEHGVLSLKLARQAIYHEHALEYIDVHARDVQHLDDVLGRKLYQLGLRW